MLGRASEGVVSDGFFAVEAVDDNAVGACLLGYQGIRKKMLLVPPLQTATDPSWLLMVLESVLLRLGRDRDGGKSSKRDVPAAAYDMVLGLERN